MAAGLPCVTTELGTGTSFVVQDQVTGLVVPPRQPAALVRALHAILSDPERRQQMGAAGFARVSATFTVPLMVERVERVYREVLQLP